MYRAHGQDCLNICFMPAPLPDELLYSLIGRVCATNAFGTSRGRMRKLFGTTNIVPSADLPTRLATLQERLGEYSPWETVDDLVERATIYPYHRPFLSQSRHHVIKEMLLKGEGRSLKTTMGRVANRFGASPPLRYCSTCNEADIASHGVTYWHRAHQLPGVTKCHIHATDLVIHYDSSKATDKQLLVPAPALVTSDISAQTSDSQQVTFAVLSQEILNAQLPAMDCTVGRTLYKDALRSSGFLRNGRVDYRSLAHELRNHYRDFSGFFHRERLLSSDKTPLSWLRGVVDRPGRASHPVCHLLLIEFLFGSLRDYIYATEVYSTSNVDDSSPTRVGNTSVHVIDTEFESNLRNTKLSCRAVANALSLSVTTVVKLRRLRAIKISERRKRIDLVLSASISQALESGKSPAQIAHRVGVSISTVYRIRAQMPEVFMAAATTKHNDERDRLREHWSFTLDVTKPCGVSVARKAAPAAYMWLYRHDRDWLLEICSYRKRISSPSSRVDWHLRDQTLCMKVIAYVAALEGLESRDRISKSAMMRQVGEALVRANSEKLPLLLALLDSLEEQTFEFESLRIDRAIETLTEQALPLANWRIRRIAGIKNWSHEHDERVASVAAKLARHF